MLIFIIVVSAIWVYLDATKNKIGKTDKGGIFNMSAGAWSICTMLLWIVAFPSYLIKRNSLKQIAAEKPVIAGMRNFKAFLIAITGFGWLVAVLYADYIARMGSS